MLAVVQHQQHLLTAQHPRQQLQHRGTGRLPDPQRGGHRSGHVRLILDAGQLRQPDPVGEPSRYPGRHLSGQPGFAYPAWSRHRHQPVPAQQACDCTSRRAILIHIDVHEIRQLISHATTP